MILKILSFLLALFLASSASCQDEIIVKKIAKEHQIHCSEKNIESYLELEEITNSRFVFHARIHSAPFVLEIYGNTKKDIEGFVIRYALEQKKKFKKNFGIMNHYKKIYSLKNSLDSISIRSLFNSIFSDSTYTIPEDSLRHCYSFRLNVKCKDSLHPQHYSFYNLIDNVYKSPYNSFNISRTIKRLSHQVSIAQFLPRGREYSSGNVTSYVFTKRDSKKWRRKAPQRHYIDSIKPAFDTFINTKLDSLVKADSIEDFLVLAKFYSNGRVKVLNWNNSEYRKWSFSKFYTNNIENFYDKRRTKKQLQKLDFRSFGLEYPIILSLDTYMFDYSD